MLLCNRSHSASNDHQLETNFINHWVITNALMNNGHCNFRNSHLAETSKVTKHFSQFNDSDQWKMKPHLLSNLFSDKLMEFPTEWVYFYFWLHSYDLDWEEELVTDDQLTVVPLIFKLVIPVSLLKLIMTSTQDHLFPDQTWMGHLIDKARMSTFLAFCLTKLHRKGFYSHLKKCC